MRMKTKGPINIYCDESRQQLRRGTRDAGKKVN